MSRVASLLVVAFALAACNQNTYLLLRLDSDSPITVSSFAIALTDGAQHANATVTPPSPVTLPPEQQVSLTLAGHPTGDISVVVTATVTDGSTAGASGTVHVAGPGTTQLALTFSPGPGGGDDLGTDAAPPPPADMTVPSVPAASFALTPSATSVLEHQQFNLHIQALNASGQPENGYQGTVTLSSSWGDVTPTAQPQFANGVCDIAVSLNRETHTGFAGAVISAVDGTATGKTSEITVGIGAWKVDGTKVRLENTYMHSGMTLLESLHPGTVIAAPAGGYLLISDTTVHMGLPNATNSMEVWSSPDGMDWSAYGGMLATSMSSSTLADTSILWDGTMYHALYTGNDGTTTRLLGASSADGKSWTAETPTAPTTFQCGATTIALLYGSGTYGRIQGSGTYTCTVAANGSSQLLMNVNTTGQPWAGYVKDGSVDKLWAINGGNTYYYTSSDGINWVQSATVWTGNVWAVYWNKQRAQLEGFIDQDNNQTYYRAYRN